MTKLENLRRELLVAIAEGKGAEISHRSRYLEFAERDAKLLMDQLEVRLQNRTLSVNDLVQIDRLRLSKWSSEHESAQLRRDLHVNIPDCFKTFRILAFVRVQGEIKGGMRCEGLFSALSQLYPSGHHPYGDKSDEEHICRGMQFGRKEEKVLLYPIECLVPVDAPQKAPEDVWPSNTSGLNGKCWES